MRVAFLCSGLQPGADGVGDYTRHLAQTLTTLGHPAVCASLCDERAAQSTAAPAKTEARWRNVFERPGEARALSAWLNNFQPDWVSVQFSPFGYHPRGLGGHRAAQLRGLVPSSARRHLMLHEIWLQSDRDVRMRHRVLGFFQRFAVDAWMGSGWQPAAIHTQARFHYRCLRAHGIAAGLLPLFSTFAKADASPAAARLAVVESMRGRNLPPPSSDAASLWLGHFGAFHETAWDWVEFARHVAELAAKRNRRACFLSLGKAPNAERAWADAARRVPGADFHVLGKLPADLVPQALSACDAAFASTPWDTIEKSSAVAAWRAQDVPVLVTRAGVTPLGKLPPWPDPGLILANDYAKIALDACGRIPGPAFLEPVRAARDFLSALAPPVSPT